MIIKIQDKLIGEDNPVFFIAEAGVNHNGSLDLGISLIDAALDAGADAVKFQTFRADELNIKAAPKSTYHIETTGDDSNQTWFELLRTQEISEKMHIELMDYCKNNNIIFLSTPYGFESADLLEKLNIPAYKIASTDTNNLPLIKYIARKGKPMILSSAMCNMDEVEQAILTVKNEGLREVAMLQCTGNYPSKLSDSNLNVIKTYGDKLNCVIGYSDHTPDFINPVAATAMGAKIYEKHFTIDKSLPGPDHRMSLDPEQLKRTIDLVRKTEISLGRRHKQVLEDERENRKKLRKSLVTTKTIKQNTKIDASMVGIKRPGYGIEPKKLDEVLGKTSIRDIESDSVIDYDDLR